MRDYEWLKLARIVASNIKKGEWPCIVFVRKVDHSTNLASLISAELNGCAESVNEGVSLKVRREYAERMRNMDSGLKAIVATKVWATGLDIPTLKAVYNCGVKHSVIDMLQQAGRGERLDDDKSEFVLYDVVSANDNAAGERAAVYQDAGYEIGEPVDCDSSRLMGELLEQSKYRDASELMPAQAISAQLDGKSTPELIAIGIKAMFHWWAWLVLAILLAVGRCLSYQWM